MAIIKEELKDVTSIQLPVLLFLVAVIERKETVTKSLPI
jgi:hypothetical protein